LEGDSKKVIYEVMKPANEQSECKWKLDAVIQEIRELINLFAIFDSIHFWQNANQVAGRLANMGVNAPIEIKWCIAEWGMYCKTPKKISWSLLIMIRIHQQQIMHLTIELGRHIKETKCTTEGSSIL
jgi:hypothetical protein